MMAYPQMFQVWVTKHASHFSGTNKQVSHIAYIDNIVENMCPRCGQINNLTLHIKYCLDAGCTDVFHESITILCMSLKQTGRAATWCHV